MWELDVPIDAKAVGYRFLVEQLNIEIQTQHRWSYIGAGWESKEFKYDDLHLEVRIYPKSYQIEDSLVRHLEFALKHEGVNLAIIKKVLLTIDKQAITDYIKSAPTGKYTRKVWFLYEYLLGTFLPLPDIKRGSYVKLLDPKQYYCGKPQNSPRHRVVDNLLGNSQFSPMVRRSTRLIQYEKKDLAKVAEKLTLEYSPELLSRAVRYLYTKETIASWEIEREKPDKARIARFVALLQRDYSGHELSKRMLLMIQKEVLDPRFLLQDYRDFQNYVGEEPMLGELLVHYIAPKPEDLHSLMEGLLKSAFRMFASSTDPVVTAAVLSFGFVFMHPFSDGNGRMHRFLIHYTLSKLNFVPKGLVFPVSSVMLREHKEYDNCLESFSRPLNELITAYEMDESGEMVVSQETRDFYRYIDFTAFAEFLYRCVERTIHTDLEIELNFLSRYDEIKQSIKSIIEMPDRQIDLFIRCVRQNGGSLSKRKQESLFDMLEEDEIKQMEAVISLNKPPKL